MIQTDMRTTGTRIGPGEARLDESCSPGVEAVAGAFERFAAGATVGEPAWLNPIRKSGLARFADLGYPTTGHEDWRYTNVAAVPRLPFIPSLAVGGEGFTGNLAELAPLGALDGDLVVLVDGVFSASLSRLTPGGALVQPLSAALKAGGEVAGWLRESFGNTAEATDAFGALNDAFFTDGLVLRIPEGRTDSPVVNLVHVATGGTQGASHHVRNLIVAGARSRVTVFESYVGVSGRAYVTNAVTDVVVGEESVVEFGRYQDEAMEAFHLGTLRATLGRGGRLVAHSIALGGKLSRQSIRTKLDGEGVEAVLNGLYVAHCDQLMDHHMVVDHAKPHCASHEYFNGVLGGRSRGVFHGRILVRKDAQKTDAKQTNKNLLLSDDAEVDTKPQLEIYADDVKCTHGATIGQMNPESIFYLRARGIGEATARRMLVHAFAGEIIDRIECAPVRELLDRNAWDRLEVHDLLASAP